MNKNVLISIQGLQLSDSGALEVASDEGLDRIEAICPGEYYYRNGAHYLLYEELVEDYGEPLKDMIKLKNKEFVLTKKGAVNMQMVFSEGKKTMTEYLTPFGNILIAIDTEKVTVEESDSRLSVHIKYGLEANYQFIADCSVTVDVKNRL